MAPGSVTLVGKPRIVQHVTLVPNGEPDQEGNKKYTLILCLVSLFCLMSFFLFLKRFQGSPIHHYYF